METDNERNRNRMYTGLFFIAAGILLFADKMGAPLPYWLFTWPVGLIAFGLLLGVRHSFRNAGALILIVVGVLNLVDMIYPSLNFDAYTIPLVVITIGVIFIVRPGKGSFKPGRTMEDSYAINQKENFDFAQSEKKNDPSDFIDSTSVFGNVKKNIVSKNFLGGDITCFMGGAEINLLQADIQSRAFLDVTQVFGGTKIIVPANWDIKTEVMTVFGGIEDKRPVQAGNVNPEKLLVIRGTSVFGGIDIRSY